MIKLVAFDLDGTIGDTIPMCINAFKKAAAPYVLHEISEEEVVQTFGLNEEGMIKQVAGKNWKKALDDFYVYYSQMHKMCPSPFNGILELIQEIRTKTIPVALITGKGEKSCAITLKKFGMDNCFDCIETGSPERNRKTEAICSLLDKYHLQPEEFIYIGDAISDVYACRKAGVQCLSAAWAPNVSIHELEEINASNIIGSIPELRDRIQAILKNPSMIPRSMPKP